MLQISHLFLPFVYPAFGLRAQGAASGSDWDSAHHHKLAAHAQGSGSPRHSTAPRAGGGDQGRILTWGAAALCWAWRMLLLCLPMCALSLAQQAGDRPPFLHSGKIVCSSGTIWNLGWCPSLGLIPGVLAPSPSIALGREETLQSSPLTAFSLTTEGWCLRILFSLDWCGVTDPSRQQDSGLQETTWHSRKWKKKS